jgi:hypothetical protein
MTQQTLKQMTPSVDNEQPVGPRKRAGIVLIATSVFA